MRNLIRIFFKHKLLISLSFVIFAGLVVGKIAITKPTYASSVILKFENKKSLLELENERFTISDNMQLVKIHKVQIQNSALLRKLIVDFDLLNRPEFRHKPRHIPARLRGLFTLFSPELTVDSSGCSSPRDPVLYTLKKFKAKSLKIKEVAFTNLLEVGVELRDAELAAAVADSLATRYIRWNIEEKTAEAKKLLAFISDEVSEIHGRINEYQDRIVKFKKTDGLNLAGISKSEINSTLENISTFEQQTSEALSARQAALDLRLQEAEAGMAPLLQQLKSLPAFDSLRHEIEAFETKRAQLLKIYTDAHPKVQKTDEALGRSLEAFIHSPVVSAAAQKAGVRTSRLSGPLAELLSIEQLQVRMKSFGRIRSDLDKQRWVVNERYLPEGEKEIQQLQHQLSLYKENYQFVFEEMEKARLHLAKNDSPEITIIEHAAVSPIPIDKPLPLLIFGLFMGMIVSLALGYFVELGDTTFGSPTERVAKELGVGLMATCPFVRRFGLRRGYSNLIGQMQRFNPIESWLNKAEAPVRQLLITSAAPREGKSTVTVNLARLLALSGKRRILLVDCGLPYGRSLSASLAPATPTAFAMLQKAGAELAIATPQGEQFGLIHLGSCEREIITTLHAERFNQFMAQAGAGYDLVLFDCPALFSSSIALHVSQFVNHSLLVLESEKTRREVASRAVQTLQDYSRSQIVGIFLNKVRYHIPDFIYRNL